MKTEFAVSRAETSSRYETWQAHKNGMDCLQTGWCGRKWWCFCVYLVKCSDHSYTDTTNGKNYVVGQLVNTGDIVGSGRTLVIENAFPTMSLLHDSVDWKLPVIATQRGRIAHLPANINQYRQRCKHWLRGYSQTLHSDDINLQFWNDSNAAVLLDNDFPAGEDQWSHRN